MSVYIPLLAGVFACLIFLLASPDGTCGATETRWRSCSLSGRVETGRRRARIKELRARDRHGGTTVQPGQ